MTSLGPGNYAARKPRCCPVSQPTQNGRRFIPVVRMLAHGVRFCLAQNQLSFFIRIHATRVLAARENRELQTRSRKSGRPGPALGPPADASGPLAPP